MISTNNDIDRLLSQRIHLTDVRKINLWAALSYCNREYLYYLAKSCDGETGVNALWCLTHMKDNDAIWLQSLQDELIDMLLSEKHIGRRRMLLQLLREQSYAPETIRADFLDYCFSKINSECEPYAIRCFSIYCAFKMCKSYPELIAELNEHLNMMALQSLSPGLVSALRTTRKKISRLRCK